jgi:8-oxo-dGTP pyrophosphatase MutT (NUDIX family)
MKEDKKQFAVVVGFARDKEGRMLLQKRVDPQTPEADGKWEFPGGKIHFGEAPEEAIIREFKEEAGCDIVVGRLLPIVQSKIWPRSDGGVSHVLVFCFEVEVVGGVPRPQDKKVSEVGWFTEKETQSLDALVSIKKFIELV